MKLPKLARSRSSSSSSSTQSPVPSPGTSMRSPASPSISPGAVKRSAGGSPAACFPLPSIVGRSRSRRQQQQQQVSIDAEQTININKSPLNEATTSGGSGAVKSTGGPGTPDPRLPWGVREEYEQVFRQFDADGDGRISADEVHAVLKALGEDATPEEAARMVKDADLDGDGYIDWEEFLGLMDISGTPPPQPPVSKEAPVPAASPAPQHEEHVMMMKSVFGVFDLDGDGKITAEELHKVLSRLGDTRSSFNDCRRMIRSVAGKSAALYVDFDDFHRMMTTTPFLQH